MARLTVLSGPSGVGKGTVVAEVRRRHPAVWVSVSVTTRKARAAKIMERLEISPTRRVRGLGANQRKALEAEFADDKVV